MNRNSKMFEKSKQCLLENNQKNLVEDKAI